VYKLLDYYPQGLSWGVDKLEENDIGALLTRTLCLTMNVLFPP